MEAVIEDQVTNRFSAAQLPSWNLLSRTKFSFHFLKCVDYFCKIIDIVCFQLATHNVMDCWIHVPLLRSGTMSDRFVCYCNCIDDRVYFYYRNGPTREVSTRF